MAILSLVSNATTEGSSWSPFLTQSPAQSIHCQLIYISSEPAWCFSESRRIPSNVPCFLVCTSINKHALSYRRPPCPTLLSILTPIFRIAARARKESQIQNQMLSFKSAVGLDLSFAFHAEDFSTALFNISSFGIQKL